MPYNACTVEENAATKREVYSSRNLLGYTRDWVHVVIAHVYKKIMGRKGKRSQSWLLSAEKKFGTLLCLTYKHAMPLGIRAPWRMEVCFQLLMFKIGKGKEKDKQARERYLKTAEKLAAATLLNRLVVIKQM